MKVDSYPPSNGGSGGGLPEPERFWAEVLSEDAERIRAALGSLSEEDARRVQDHLRRMATEDGWQPAQRRSARAALHQLGTPNDTEAR